MPYSLFLLCVYLTFNVVEEDAFIYFRLAENFANGHGIVFNVGGERIESGSGLTWFFLLALLAALPVNLVFATKILGIVCALLAIWKLLQVSQRFISGPLAYFPAMCLAVSTPFFFWAHRGLETPLYIFLLSWLFETVSNREKISYWFVPAFLVFCSRPEGFLMVAAVLPWIWWERKNIKGFWQGVGLLAFACVMLFAWRLYYFHDLLPHAFYHKIGGNYSRSIEDLFHYAYYNGLLLLGVWAISIGLKFKYWQRELTPLVLLVAVCTLWGIIGADWKSFNRQLSMLLPFYFLLVFIFIARVEEKSVLGKLTPIVASVYLLTLFIFSPFTASSGKVMFSPIYTSLFSIVLPDPVAYQRSLNKLFKNPETYMEGSEPTMAGDHIGFNRNATVGRFIEENYPEGITVIFDQMGQAPWYAGSDKTFIDNTGLTDKAVGYYGFHFKAQQSQIFGLYEKILIGLKKVLFPDEQHLLTKAQLIERFYELDPELVLIRERYLEKYPNTLIGTMFHDPRFAERYKKTIRINKRDVIYQRRDVPSPDPVSVPTASLVEYSWE